MKYRSFIVRHGEAVPAHYDDKGNMIPPMPINAHECLDLPSFYHCITHLVCLGKDFTVTINLEDDVAQLRVPLREEVENG